ncbi:Sugar kinase of the NBD/HSP70 family, may contain an N-terminal HTH domain [Actinopolyspora alba]|uniref:Sugar kinase of the NBD/HSP70 family, may contain an N-terminal HTH domain n=1 Tax=Actinopolyspora alba TaxID=673379 RepID=A0A1I2BCD1_9ACTN|nr:ROK family protein [Actinopolyspora alba]SFE53872.1 Sugar kinase of the NBD/HSP70 family, may contain an N-terminal HTH domain [Actinopolyspora alba]
MADPRTVRQLNRQHMIELFSDGQARSRAAVARTTGLTKPSVSSIIDSLLEEELLIPAGVGEAAVAGGRRPNLVVFNPDARAYVGVHLGVRDSSVAVADALGRTLAQASAPSSVGDAATGVNRLDPLVREAAERAGVPVERVSAVGVSVSGLVDHRSGRCLLAPNLDWHDVPLREWVEELFGVPAVIYNEAHAGALAEQRFGWGDGVANFVRIMVDTGIGAGVVLDSRLFSGAAGIGGEIGHCRVEDNGRQCACGNSGCLESVASRPAILRSVREAAEAGTPTALAPDCDIDAVLAAAESGDAGAVAALRRAGTALGHGIAYLRNVLNPDLVVLGGAVSGAGEVLRLPMEQAVRCSSLPHSACRLETSSLRDAELDGAVLLAHEQLTL